MFSVYVDSAANLPAVVASKYGINVISFVNFVDGKELICYDSTLTPEQEREKGADYYNAMRGGSDVKTGLISIQTFTEKFKKEIDNGNDVLYITLSKNISGNYNSSRLAAQEVLSDSETDRKIRIVDSLNASLAQGILAIYACEMQKIGKDIDEVADILESYVPKMNGVFTVGDLKYLSKTGRITGTVAKIGNALGIKPILRGNGEGFIVQYKNVRGRKTALAELVNLVCNNIENPEEQIIGIAHADAYEESLFVMQEIEKRVKVRDFINTSYDFCTGSHVGPDTIALFFMAKDRELSN